MRIFLNSMIPVLFFALACTKEGGEYARVSPAEAYGLLRNDFAILVDVREPADTADGVAAPAVRFAGSLIESDAPEWRRFRETILKDKKDKQVILYGNSADHVDSLAKGLVAQGYRVANMGSYSDWVSSGLPVKK